MTQEKTFKELFPELKGIKTTQKKTSDEYYYCSKCNKEFTYDECNRIGEPISGFFMVSPCCESDIYWEDNIVKKERNVVIKTFINKDDVQKNCLSKQRVKEAIYLSLNQGKTTQAIEFILKELEMEE